MKKIANSVVLHLSLCVLAVELLSLVGFQWTLANRLVAEIIYLFFLATVAWVWSLRWSFSLIGFAMLMGEVRSYLGISFYADQGHWVMKLDEVLCILWILVFIIGFIDETPFLRSRLGFLLNWLKITSQDKGNSMRPEYIKQDGVHRYIQKFFLSRSVGLLFCFSAFFLFLGAHYTPAFFLGVFGIWLDTEAPKYKHQWLEGLKTIIAKEKAEHIQYWTSYWDVQFQNAVGEERDMYGKLHTFSLLSELKN